MKCPHDVPSGMMCPQCTFVVAKVKLETQQRIGEATHAQIQSMAACVERFKAILRCEHPAPRGYGELWCPDCGAIRAHGTWVSPISISVAIDFDEAIEAFCDSLSPAAPSPEPVRS